MNSRSLKLLALGSYCESVAGDSLPDLKDLVRESTGVAVRRVSRFVQLALIGAGRCCHTTTVPTETAVYFSSCRGDTEVTTELLEDMIRRREMPGPLTFVNSVSNAACFHVASVLGLQNRSNFITNRFDPITGALKAALVDLLRDEVTTALVGSVDACSLPLDHHRQRTQRGPEPILGEASHWVMVAREGDCRPALAHFRAIENFGSWDRLAEWLKMTALRTDTVLACGQHLSSAGAGSVLAATGLSTQLFYRESLPHYDSQTGAAIEQFIASPHEAMLHVNSDPSGRFSVLLLEKP